jgi:hypothetical protein
VVVKVVWGRRLLRVRFMRGERLRINRHAMKLVIDTNKASQPKRVVRWSGQSRSFRDLSICMGIKGIKVRRGLIKTIAPEKKPLRGCLALCKFPAHVMQKKTNACVWNVNVVVVIAVLGV